MSYAAVLPIAYEPYGRDCLATIRLDPARVLIVDNTRINRGVMRSHNLGIDLMQQIDADWLIIISAAIRFGAAGGCDFVEQLTGGHVIESEDVYGWHLIAFARETIERAGRWDENLWPYGFDDLDYSTRIQRAFQLDTDRPLWTKVPVDATDMGMGHSLKLGQVDAPASPRLSYYCAKWGVTLDTDGGKSEPAYLHPFDDPGRPVTWWPTPPDPRALDHEGWAM